MCRAEEAAFRETIGKQVLPFGNGDTSWRIVSRIKEYLAQEDGKEIDLKKKFYDVDFEI